LSPKRTAESGIVTIFHLSYPKGSPDSLNAHIPTEAFTLQYICIDVDVAISLVLEHGPGCFMRKKKKNIFNLVSALLLSTLMTGNY